MYLFASSPHPRYAGVCVYTLASLLICRCTCSHVLITHYVQMYVFASLPHSPYADVCVRWVRWRALSQRSVPLRPCDLRVGSGDPLFPAPIPKLYPPPPPSHEQVEVTGIPPSPRGGHTAGVYGDTMYAFGGKSGRSPFNDLCGFNFERGSWERVQVGCVMACLRPLATRSFALPLAQVNSAAPAPRCAHVCVVFGHSLFVFGGYDGRRYVSLSVVLWLRPHPSTSLHNSPPPASSLHPPHYPPPSL